MLIENEVKEALDAWREVLQMGLQEYSTERMWNALDALRVACNLDFSAQAIGKSTDDGDCDHVA